MTEKGILVGITIFILGVTLFLGISGKKESLIIFVIAQEIILLAIGILFVHITFTIDDMLGAALTLYLLILAGAESAIILAIYIAFYPKRGTMTIN